MAPRKSTGKSAPAAQPPKKRAKSVSTKQPSDEVDAQSEATSKGAASASSELGSPKMPTAEEIAAVEKNDMSTFVTLAKRSTNPDMIAAYDKYRTASRFDDSKKQIVALWKSDKDCKWWNSWNQSDVQEDTVSKEDLSGYGTK